MGVLQLLDGAADDAGAGGIGEEGQLIEGALAAEGRALALDLDGDEVGPLDGLCCRHRSLSSVYASGGSIIAGIGRGRAVWAISRGGVTT